VIRALYDFLSHRVVKPMYHEADIPIGEYQRDLRDSNRSTTEQFLAAFVEAQPADAVTATLTIDQVVELVQKHRRDMGEPECSKASISREITLTSIQGVTRRRVRKHIAAGTGDDAAAADDDDEARTTRTGPGKRVVEYTLDLVLLRRRYRLVDENEATTGDVGGDGPDGGGADITNTPEGDMQAFVDVLRKTHTDDGYTSDDGYGDMEVEEEGDGVEREAESAGHSDEDDDGDALESHGGLNRKRPVTPDEEDQCEEEGSGGVSDGKRPCRV
jgi:hypothetical protein